MSKILGIVIILAVIIIFLLFRLFYVNRELRKITKQLDEYNDFKTKKKIDINLVNKNIELLAASINKHMEISKELQIKQINAEDNLKNMIAGISHDLRTPLTSIKGYLQMLKNPRLTEEKKEIYIDRADKRAKDLQILLDEFFMLSVIDSKDYTIKLESVNLKEILIEILASFYDEFSSKNINPDIEICNEAINVLGDSFSIKRVIENLMINISKHSKGNIKINLIKDNKVAELTVIDLAENISEEKCARLFDRFYNDDKSKGTGLGLAIVKELMIKMNGSVSAEIKLNKLYITCTWNLI